MLKQRKTGGYDEQLSPDDEHFLSRKISMEISLKTMVFLDHNECSSDGSNLSQKDLVFPD